MKAITISVVENGFLVQGYPPRGQNSCFEPPLADFLYVFNRIEDLQEQLPKLLGEPKSLADLKIPVAQSGGMG